MNATLTNVSGASGTYQGEPLTLTSNTVVVNMISGLTMTLSADKAVWLDGNLTYTIIIDNKSGDTYVAPVVTDTLDLTNVNFVDDSVYIDGVKSPSAYTYDSATGLLTINLTDIADQGTRTITFQVNKKA